MTSQEAVHLLNEIVAFAQEIICRPLGNLMERCACCEELEAKLEGMIAVSAGASRFLDNGAPSLLFAIDRTLYHRHLCNEEMAAKWDAVIGHLMPMVRSDAAAVLASMHEAQERPQR